MVSNAALKFKDTNIVHLPLSEAIGICRSTSYTEPSRKSASFYKLTKAGCNRENYSNMRVKPREKKPFKYF